MASADGEGGRRLVGGIEVVLDDVTEDEGGDVNAGEEEEVGGDAVQGFVHEQSPFDRCVSVVVRSAAGVGTAADRSWRTR
ncbi:hypothetical protein [Nocardia sp. CA-120079]|uniref:hypothetical protein n=1 Tax=Nocardia sp. CA-120079 TaxID=3239974 RepID=UPI003D95E010